MTPWLTRKHSPLILTLALLSCCLPSFAQTVYYQNFTSKDGLSTANCHYLLQDSRGFIWVATNTGLDRYDGTSFQSFGADRGFTGSIVKKIKEDEQHRIWAITFFDGLFLSDQNGANPTFREHPLNDSIKALAPGMSDFEVEYDQVVGVSAAQYQAKGIGSKNPTLTMHELRGTLIHQTVEKRALGMQQMPVGRVVHVRKNDSLEFQIPTIRSPEVVPVYVDSTAMVHGSFLISIGENGCTIDTLPASTRAVNKLNDNELILGTSKGLWHYNRAEKLASLLIPNLMVTHLMRDSQNNLWVATTRNGLFKVPSFQVLSYPLTEGFSQSLVGFSVDGPTDRICAYSTHQVFEKLPGEPFRMIFEQPSPDITMRDVLHFSDPNKKLLVCYQGQPNLWVIQDGQSTEQVSFPLSRQVHRGKIRDNELFLTASLGAFSYDFENDIARNMQMQGETIRCRSIIADTSGIFWYGGQGGIYKETAAGLQQEFPLGGLTIDLDFCADNLIIGTQKDGIYIYNTNTKEKIHLTEADGLNSNRIAALFADGDRVYVGSTKGVNILTHTADGWHIANSYLSSILNFPTVKDLIVRNETLWVCMKHDLVSYPLNTQPPGNRAPVIITEVLAQGQSILGAAAKLPYNQNEVTIQFVSPNYVNARGDRYEYRLVGSGQDQWTPAASQSLSFAALRPGSYRFEIRNAATTASSQAEPVVTTYAFTIHPPFWLTWWFVLLEIGAGLGVVYAIIRYWSLQAANKEVVKTELARLELKALKAQINPHFIYNAIASIQSYLIKNQSEEAEKYMRDFANLIRKVLEHSDQSMVSLQSELDLIGNYVDLESQKFRDSGIDLQQEIDSGIDPEQVRIPPALFQPYVENALWHGLRNKDGERKLTLRVQKDRNDLLIEVEDNGVGRQAASKQKAMHHGRSFGISIATQRIQALNGSKTNRNVEMLDLKDQHGTALGTKVSLFIPYTELAS